MAADPIFYALPVFFGSIFVEAACARVMQKPAYDLRDALTSLNLGTLSQLVNAVTKLAALGIYVAFYRHLGFKLWPAGGLAAWAAALVFYDFCYYWNHRLDHEVGLMWAAHVVHHSSEYFNLSTALRQSSTIALCGWVFYVPMAIVGVPPAMFVVVALIDLLYQYWVHTELIGRCGPLEWVFVTPSNHRVHHGQNDYCIDRNYGGIFIVWDRLFGTFADERRDEKVVYGIRKALHSFEPVWGNLHVYRDLWREMRSAPTLRQKLSVWIAPPGGWREGPVEHFDTRDFVHYAPPCPLSLQIYVLGQFVLASVAMSMFLGGAEGVSAGMLAMLAGLILASMVCQGGLLQGAGWARRVELGRLVAQAGVGVLLAILAPGFLGSGIVAASAISLIWLAVLARGRAVTA